MNRGRWTFWFFVLLTTVVSGLYFVAIQLKKAEGSKSAAVNDVLPVIGPAPDFQWTRDNGQVFQKPDLSGKVWIADFIFTRCQGQCPIMSQQMARLSQELPGVYFVSFSVDPDFDTPEVLATYAKTYRVDPDRWVLLSGSREKLNEASAGFKLSQIDEPAFHSASFILVDQQGMIRGYYDANDAARTDQLAEDARKLISLGRRR